MRLLRDNLIISPQHDKPGCLLLDQQTGDEYEFGEVEHFLLEHFRQPCDPDQLCDELNTRFGLTYSLDDLESFLNLLEDWGLLSKQGTTPLPQPILLDNVQNEPDTLTDDFSNKVKMPDTWKLFNPERFFDGFNRLFPNLRWLLWLTPIIVAVATLAILFKYQAFLADFTYAKNWFGTIGRFVLDLFTINLAVQIARGILARRLGLATPEFNVVFLFGFFPSFSVRFFVQEGELERGARLLLSAVSTLMRLWIFAITALLWAITRSSGTFLPSIAIEITYVAALTLLFVANPFFGSGARFMSAWLDTPDIQQSSRKSLMGLLFGRPAAIARHSRHNVRVILFGLLSLVLFWGIVGFIVFGIFNTLETRFQGAGVALFLFLGAIASFSLYRQSIAKKATQASKLINRQARSGRSQAGTAASASNRSARISRSNPVNRAKPWRSYLLYIIVLIVLFLPYRYETGGDAEVFPSARVTITVDFDGILEEINFKGGEHVKAGTVLARISDYNQFYALHMLEADIESQKYKIKQYQTTPSIEDIRLAEEKIRSARLQAEYSTEKLVRQEALALQGFISPQALSDVRAVTIRDKQALEEAVASLNSIKAQVNPYQIQGLIADLMKMQRQADYDREKLRRTQLISPIDGQIVTTDLQYLRNSFLEAGAKFADIEDVRSVNVQISVPEADLSDVSIGAPITLKLSAYSDREFMGKVNEIPLVATVKSTTDTSRFFQVSGVLNNPHGLLRTGLTGSAKITGNETIVLLAFTRALIRFVTIEVWSWLP